MASSTSAPLQEWLVIVPDHAGALQKRLASRPKHLEGLKADREDMWLWGGMSNFISISISISVLLSLLPHQSTAA
jgi:hypothetical protein